MSKARQNQDALKIMQTLQSSQLKKLGVVARKCSIKKVFLKNRPNSLKITSAEVSF